MADILDFLPPSKRTELTMERMALVRCAAEATQRANALEERVADLEAQLDADPYRRARALEAVAEAARLLIEAHESMGIDDDELRAREDRYVKARYRAAGQGVTVDPLTEAARVAELEGLLDGAHRRRRRGLEVEMRLRAQSKALEAVAAADLALLGELSGLRDTRGLDERLIEERLQAAEAAFHEARHEAGLA